MILYHFSTSPFARRVRLVLSMKGLTAELRDARADRAHLPDLHRLNPMQTVPTLVDGTRVLTDSLAIAAYLEDLAPSPSIWPTTNEKGEALEFVRLADRAIDKIADLALRYRALHDAPAFSEVKAHMIGRVQGALDRIASRIDARGAAPFLVGDAWTLADIAIVTLGLWLDGLPARAATYAPAKTILELGWHLPPSLAEWARARRDRPDVAALG